MQALFYETFIRQAHSCGRNYSKGADADIYRKMEHAHRDLGLQSMYKTQADREFEFRSCFATVRGHVANAIYVCTTAFRHLFSEDEMLSFEQMRNELNLTFFDKHRLDEIISFSSKVLRKHNVMPT